MPQSNEYLQYILDQLDGLRAVVHRRMFSGVGLYQDQVFFGLLFRDTLYFKVDDSNRADYESRGMGRFQPYADKPYLSFTYYEVPADVLEDREQLTAWARRSVAAAIAIEAKKRAARKPSTKRTQRAASKRATARNDAPATKRAAARNGAPAAKRATARKRASAKKKRPAKR